MSILKTIFLLSLCIVPKTLFSSERAREALLNLAKENLLKSTFFFINLCIFQMFIKSTKIHKQKSEKKSIFYLFVKNFVCTVLISILVFSIAFKKIL